MSLTSALLAWVAGGLGVYFLIASHATTSGCLVDQGMKVAAYLTAPVGAFLSITAIATGFMSVFGPRRTRGRYLAFGIAGLAMGFIALLVCAGLWMGANGGSANPRYLHPC